MNGESDTAPVLEVEDLKKHFPAAGTWPLGGGSSVKAVDGVAFGERRGEPLGLGGR